MQDPADQVAIVTGAAGNLGRAVAAAFAARGSRLALVDRNAQALESVSNDLPPGTECAVFPVDLLDPAAVTAMAGAVAARFGRIDALANLAGGFAMGPPLHETADRDWDFMLDLNLRSVFHCCRAAVPHLLAAGGGYIVNVSARAAVRGSGHMGPYCASKAAVIALTESLADELKDSGINVNCVLPGTLDTPQNRAAMPDADPALWVAPAALAEVVVFLASHGARAIVGAAVPVFGRT